MPESEKSTSPTPSDIGKPGIFSRMISFILVRFGWMTMRLFFRVKLVGLEHIPRSGPVLIVSNHPSYLEPVLFVSTAHMHLGRPIAFMAWDKLFRIPGVGAILKTFGAFPVDLANPGRKPYETLLRVLRGGGMAGIFPEGQRSEQATMGEWKPGALRAALSTDPTIIPVSVVGARDAWPVSATLPRPFRRVTLHIHRGRKLDEMGGGPAPSGSAKDWLRSIENEVRSEINATLIEYETFKITRVRDNYQAAKQKNAKDSKSSMLPKSN